MPSPNPQAISQPISQPSPEPTLEQRKIIYRARRGLKELDYYIDPYIRTHFLSASQEEQAVFARLIEQEDPDLLDWFLFNAAAPDPEIGKLILKLKNLHAGKSHDSP